MATMNMAALFFLLLFVSVARAQVFDITKYGGKPNGDIGPALTSAFKAACAATTASKIVVPKSTYTLTPVEFTGPCKAPIEFRFDGTITAQTEKTKPDSSWVAFTRIDHLTVSGSAVFDGVGAKVWGSCGRSAYCAHLPINFRFDFVTNSMVTGITSKDSKQFHVNVLGCKEITFKQFTISAPEGSLNTDGIHIGRSTGVHVLNSNIKTGDDCVSIGDGSKQIEVIGVTCGPGHGISVGSLGKYQNEEPVVGVNVKNCTMSNTMNGVRIKTWPASYPGTVSDMHFEDITMNNVANPIIIDQVYCPWNQCNAKVPSKVKISNVSFRRIKGTSSTPVAVKLACSSGMPCSGVEVADIDLAYTGGEAPKALSQCSHVQPKISGTMNPPACSSPVQDTLN